jgi:hypothetical protein
MDIIAQVPALYELLTAMQLAAASQQVSAGTELGAFFHTHSTVSIRYSRGYNVTIYTEGYIDLDRYISILVRDLNGYSAME